MLSKQCLERTLTPTFALTAPTWSSTPAEQVSPTPNLPTTREQSWAPTLALDFPERAISLPQTLSPTPLAEPPTTTLAPTMCAEHVSIDVNAVFNSTQNSTFSVIYIKLQKVNAQGLVGR